MPHRLDNAVQAFLLYVLALCAGVSVAVQQVLNGGLRTALGSPAWAGFVSYVGGLLTMIVVLLVLGEHLPSWKAVTNTPWWAWSGGILGGVFIFVGFLPNSQLLKPHVEHEAAGYLVTDRNMQTSIPGIWAVGDVRAQLTKQIATAVGDGTTAAVAASQYVDHLRDQERGAA